MAGKSDASAPAYSVADRLLHRLAFAHPVPQKALGELESDLLARRYAHVEARRPVFVTGLPRAGSTLANVTINVRGIVIAAFADGSTEPVGQVAHPAQRRGEADQRRQRHRPPGAPGRCAAELTHLAA